MVDNSLLKSHWIILSSIFLYLCIHKRIAYSQITTYVSEHLIKTKLWFHSISIHICKGVIGVRPSSFLLAVKDTNIRI